MRRLVSALAAGLLAALMLSGCSQPATSSGGQGYVSGDGTITQLPAAHRKSPGPISGKTLDGQRVSLSDYAGKVVVVNVWGSWCGECRQEAPALVAAAHRLAGHGVVFLGIDSRDYSIANARAFVRHFHVPYPSIYDQSARTLLSFRGTLAPNTIPSTVVIDRRGRVAASVLGRVDTTTLVDLVRSVGRPSRGEA